MRSSGCGETKIIKGIKQRNNIEANWMDHMQRPLDKEAAVEQLVVNHLCHWQIVWPVNLPLWFCTSISPIANIYTVQVSVILFQR